MSPYVSSFGTQSFDRDHFVSLVSNFRESLGFEAADTESTFDPWDVVSLEPSGLDMHDGKPNYAWLNMWDYWMKLPKHVRERHTELCFPTESEARCFLLLHGVHACVPR